MDRGGGVLDEKYQNRNRYNPLIGRRDGVKRIRTSRGLRKVLTISTTDDDVSGADFRIERCCAVVSTLAASPGLRRRLEVGGQRRGKSQGSE